MSGTSGLSRANWSQALTLPPPDSPGGVAIAIAALFASVYAILLVAAYPSMTSFGFAITTIALLGGVVGTFSLGAMIGSDIATYQRLELDLARTVIAHTAANEAPEPDAPLAGVWRAYVTVADESRRVARVHAYSFGLFLWGTLLSLAAALVAGLGVVTSTTNVVGIALVVQFFGFALLLVGSGGLVLTVGYSDEVPGFDLLAARRWRRNSARLPAVEEALGNVPWLPEFHRGVRESRTHPSGSTLRWISQ
jgi:hypothetical protein